jgi:hypothetical protein
VSVIRLPAVLRRFGASYQQAWSGARHPDPTRPGAARIRDGVPIAHDGPPGYPGRSAVPGDADPLLLGVKATRC